MPAVLRNEKGLTLPETGAALAMFLPLVVLIMLVTIETSKAYQVSRDLQIGASLAARALAASGSTTTTSQQSEILSHVTVANHVVDPSQFYNVQWNKTGQPPSVTVYIQYRSNGTKQPAPFPDPDPLHLGWLFNMKSNATFRLQS